MTPVCTSPGHIDVQHCDSLSDVILIIDIREPRVVLCGTLIIGTVQLKYLKESSAAALTSS